MDFTTTYRAMMKKASTHGMTKTGGLWEYIKAWWNNKPFPVRGAPAPTLNELNQQLKRIGRPPMTQERFDRIPAGIEAKRKQESKGAETDQATDVTPDTKYGDQIQRPVWRR